MSVCLSVCPLTFRVRPEASTVQDGFFPYLVQMINSMRGCVACDYLRPWPISSRSFGLDLENRVRSVASTVLDGFVLFLAQMIAIIRECVACYVFFRIWKIEFLKADLWYFIDDSPKNFCTNTFCDLRLKSTVTGLQHCFLSYPTISIIVFRFAKFVVVNVLYSPLLTKV